MYQDNIEISETLLRIYRTSQNIFKEMIYLLLTMSEEFEGSRFFLVKKKNNNKKPAFFTYVLIPMTTRELVKPLYKTNDTPNQTLRVQIVGL